MRKRPAVVGVGGVRGIDGDMLPALELPSDSVVDVDNDDRARLRTDDDADDAERRRISC